MRQVFRAKTASLRHAAAGRLCRSRASRRGACIGFRGLRADSGKTSQASLVPIGLRLASLDPG
jgi:hypothetical protein